MPTLPERASLDWLKKTAKQNLAALRAADPKAKLAEIEERLNRLRSPFRSAERFWVEEIIDPRRTRSLLCEFARLAEPVRRPGVASFLIRP